MCMNFKPKKKIEVKFILPNYVDVRLGDLKEFFQESINKATFGDLQKSSYLSKVPSEYSEETPGYTLSKRQYNRRSRSFIDSQASEKSSEESSKGYYFSNYQNHDASQNLVAYSMCSNLSEYRKVNELGSKRVNLVEKLLVQKIVLIVSTV